MSTASASAQEQPRIGKCGYVPPVADPAGLEFVTLNAKWDKSAVQYRFASFCRDLPVSTVRSVIQQAFDTWSATTPIQFIETSAATGDIEIEFRENDDGPGSSLAFVPNPIPIDNPIRSRKVIFDDAEQWSTNPNSNQFDLLMIAIHEIGHTLGLDHTQNTNPSAIMRPSFSAGSTQSNLTQDDIDGIVSLYGFPKADQYFVGDWTGDGKKKFAIRSGNTFFFQKELGKLDLVAQAGFGNGNSEDQYLVGDWTGDGKDKIAVRRGNQVIMQTHLRATGLTNDVLVVHFGDGPGESQYLVGDWTGDGRDKLAVRRGGLLIFQETFGASGLNGGVSSAGFGNGPSEDEYLVGDWTGDGRDKFAVRRGGQVICQNHIRASGLANDVTVVGFGNGPGENQYLVGDWNGDRRSKLAVRRHNQLICQNHFGASGLNNDVTAIRYGIGTR